MVHLWNLLTCKEALRQRDPLSPYLFILVIETFVIMVKLAESMGFIKPVLIGMEKVLVKHIEFANDILIFHPRDPEA